METELPIIELSMTDDNDSLPKDRHGPDCNLMSLSPRRLLMLVHSLEGGGGERQLAILSSGLARSGWDVHVLTMTSGGRYWGELSSVQGVTSGTLDRVSRFDFSVLLKCAKYIARNQIRIVQGW